jgi:hypothetical protein
MSDYHKIIERDVISYYKHLKTLGVEDPTEVILEEIKEFLVEYRDKKRRNLTHCGNKSDETCGFKSCGCKPNYYRYEEFGSCSKCGQCNMTTDMKCDVVLYKVDDKELICNKCRKF